MAKLNIGVTMYDPIILQERMAERGLNFYRLAKEAGVDPKTAKNVVTKGMGQPDKVKAIAKTLDLELSEIVKRHVGAGLPDTKPKRRKSA